MCFYFPFCFEFALTTPSPRLQFVLVTPSPPQKFCWPLLWPKVIPLHFYCSFWNQFSSKTIKKGCTICWPVFMVIQKAILEESFGPNNFCMGWICNAFLLTNFPKIPKKIENGLFAAVSINVSIAELTKTCMLGPQLGENLHSQPPPPRKKETLRG